MALTNEWKSRIDMWINELKNQFYAPLGEIKFSGFTTFDYVNVDDVVTNEFQPMPTGTLWGREWEYGWFIGEVVLPEKAYGKRIAIDLNIGGEATLFVNRENFGTRRDDWIVERHHFMCDCYITKCGIPGKRYEILAECYGGHEMPPGGNNCATGPVPPERIEIIKSKETRREVGISTFGIWNETAYQLYLDVKMLYDILKNIDADSLRASEIEKGLKDFTIIVDFEQPFDQMNETFESCRLRLKHLMECSNGSTMPTMYMFGHAHIDIAWLWPLAETDRKCARTFAGQLRHMVEYPQYKLLQSQPYLYKRTKENYPKLYERIKEKVKEGQFIPEGGMWVEADTNITSGESLIRQFLHGKKFFKDEFDIDSQILWLPDVFGYSAALPQIMKKCGIKYFSTHKIFWTYNGGEPFPYHYFNWQGLDGSNIPTFIHIEYSSFTDADTVINRWKNRAQKDGLKTFMYPYGYGDGGGGASRDHIENALREKDIEGVPRVKMSSPQEFFTNIESEGPPEKRYVGELYYQAHRGTYTTQAKTKKGNRKSEFAIREAEMWGGIAKTLKGFKYPYEVMDNTWKKILLNQFHDILPGSSIERVYKEAEALYTEVIKIADEITNQAAKDIIDSDNEITVFNSLSWDRKALVELPRTYNGALGFNGETLYVQDTDNRKITEVTVPACGWTTVFPSEYSPLKYENVIVNNKLLENNHLRVRLNEKGEIASIYDKDKGKELTAGVCNKMQMYKDVPSHFEAWDIDSMYELQPVELSDNAQLEVICSGPMLGEIKVIRKINNSTMTQLISLKHNSRRVDFKTTIHWYETHKLLKVAFPVDVYTDEAIHEIQFGHLKRPNHKSRKYDADRFEVCNHKWTALTEENKGCAILNDCKYGVNVLDNCINLTLLKSALFPDVNADKGVQEFTYSFYTWNGSFTDCRLIEEAYELNIPAHTVSGNAGEKSIFYLDSQNIVIEAIKPAEDGSKDIILRLYEAKRTSTSCTLATSLQINSAIITDMLENDEKEIEVMKGKITLDFIPFEIKTIRLKMK